MTAAYTLASLPPEVIKPLLETHYLKNREEYRANALQLKAEGSGMAGTPALFGPPPKATLTYETGGLIWATENDEISVHFQDPVTEAQLEFIKPRVLKSKEEQKKRVKAKAEVFTPSWVCNLQNNLIDDAVLYSGAFNSTHDKTWMGTKRPIKFTNDYTWLQYVTEKRIEFAMGEAPYLASPYDATTGEIIPVLEKGKWQRIGLMDRKLRVLSENVKDEETWVKAAPFAYRSTYGYEWQGDNLILARLNLLNTYANYKAALGFAPPSIPELQSIAQILSWNLWQMDGLKMVQPGSCSDSCTACAQKTKAGHDGLVAIMPMGSKLKSFEELLPNEWFPKKQRK